MSVGTENVPERFPVALLREVVTNPTLLLKWALQLTPPWRIPLAVYGDGRMGQARELLHSAISQSGCDLELDINIFLLPPELTADEVVARATGVYTWETELPAPFGSLYRLPDAYIQACRHWILTQERVTSTQPGPPDFVGIGTQRGGTTWWLKLLRAHPEIEPTSWKELHFFDAMTDLPGDLYGRIFRAAKGHLTGEFTPEYMFYPWVPARLHEAVPRTKLLVILRDPLARYCSGIAFDRQRGTPEDAESRRSHFERGLYAVQLERVFAEFPRQQVLVLQYERCVRSPLEEYRRTLQFLGVGDLSFRPQAVEQRVNTTAAPVELDEPTRRELDEAYRQDAERLAELLPELDLTLWPSVAPATSRHSS
ncbi:MAG TPA: sulfotransferase [Actinomycetota bacterium]|jgi:hypothetical protein|nr:sulfotransferase [Actinomycetota bacterium]